MALAPNSNSVSITFSHNQCSIIMPEIKIDINSSIKDIKGLVEKKYGTEQNMMELMLLDTEGNLLNQLEDNELFGSYFP